MSLPLFSHFHLHSLDCCGAQVTPKHGDICYSFVQLVLDRIRLWLELRLARPMEPLLAFPTGQLL